MGVCKFAAAAVLQSKRVGPARSYKLANMESQIVSISTWIRPGRLLRPGFQRRKYLEFNI